MLGEKMYKINLSSAWSIRGRVVPKVYVYETNVGFLRTPQVYRHLKDDTIVVDDWVFSVPYGVVYIKEINQWRDEYLPPTGVKGKTVLDVGAGCGETAKFFLDNGARRVIAVEPNPRAWPFLLKNCWRSRPIEAILKPFDPEMLTTLTYDVLKMDIEGYEILMLPHLDKIEDKEIMLEAHNDYMINQFKAQGFTVADKNRRQIETGTTTLILHRGPR